jgi:hypothetical protein
MANDVHQLVIASNVATQFCETVLNFQTTVTGAAQPGVDSNDLISAWRTHVESLWLACLPNDYEAFGYKCKRVNNTGGPVEMKPITPVSGTRSSVSSTSAVGPVILTSYLEGTKHRSGRIFMPGVATDDMTENVFDATLVTALLALIAELFTPFAGPLHNWQYGIWSRKHLLFHPPEVMDLSQKPGVQDRRLKPIF